MMKLLQTILVNVLLITGAVLLAPFSNGGSLMGQNTPGTVTFTLKTVTENGYYAPKHVFGNLGRI